MKPTESIPDFSTVPAVLSTVSFSSPAPPPPRLHGCDAKRARGTSAALTKSLSDPGRSICSTIADQTRPRAGSSGVAGSPRTPSTARTRSATGGRLRPNRITVGVPWPGMYAPEASTTWVRSRRGRKPSISLRPNSRFMNELAVISPTKPAGSAAPADASARSKKRSVNGAPSEYLRWHEAKRSRYAWFSAGSFGVTYGGLPTTAW